MAELSGTLDSIELQPLLGFLRELRSSGSLILEDASSSGELTLVDGHVVGASLGEERGTSALDMLVIGLRHGRFRFTPNQSGEVNLDLEPEAVAEHVRTLLSEAANWKDVLPSPLAVPRVVEFTDKGDLTLSRAALRLLLSIDGRRTLREYARGSTVLDTMQHLAQLAELHLIAVDEQASGEDSATSATVARQAPAMAVNRPNRVRLERPAPAPAPAEASKPEPPADSAASPVFRRRSSFWR